MSDSLPIADAPAPLGPSPEAPATRQGDEKAKHGVGITIARNSFWLLIDSAVGMAATFYCSIMVARGLGPDRMGQYNYIIWFAAVLRMVTEVSMPVTIRKFAAEFMGRGDYGTLKTVIRLAMRLQTKLALTGAVAGLIFVFASIAPGQRLFALLVVLSIVPAILMTIPAGALWAAENLRDNVLSSLAGTAVNVLGITASVVFHWGLLGVVVAFVSSRVVDFVLRYILFKRQYARLPGEASDAPLDPAIKKRMMGFAARQVVLMVFQVLLFDRVEIFFLKGLAEPRQIAFFSISFTLVQYMLMLPSILTGSAGATLMVEQGRAPSEVARLSAGMTWFMMLVAMPTYFGLAALSDPLLRLLYGSKYLPAIPVLAILSLFGVCRALAGPTEQFLIVTENQGFFIKWAGAVGIINALVNVLLIRKYGAVGAATAKVLSQVIAAAGFLAFMMLRYRVAFPIGRMIRLLFVCTVMYVGVRAVGRPLPSLGAILAGVPVGLIIFVVLTRVFRCLDALDGDRLRRLRRVMPDRLRNPYVAVVDFLVPA
jgi:O-antigen/teichoic acid export membrane protein